MAVEGPSDVQPQRHDTAGASDASAKTSVVRVANRFLTPKTPSPTERLFADIRSDAGSPAPGPGAIPAWALAEDDGHSPATGGATAAKPSPASAPASAPIDLASLVENGMLDAEKFVTSLDKQLGPNSQGTSIVDKGWSSASVHDVEQTYQILGKVIWGEVDVANDVELYTDLVPPKDQALLNKVVSTAKPLKNDMIALMHEIDPSTSAVKDDVLVQSNDYKKFQAYIDCLGVAAGGQIEVVALNPSGTPKPAPGKHYIVIGSGTKADVSASSNIRARLVAEVADTKLTPAAKARNLTKILEPSPTPDILARALRNPTPAQIAALKSAMRALPPQAVRAVATALAPAICEINGQPGRDLATAFLAGITAANRNDKKNNPDSPIIAAALEQVRKHAAESKP